jgi:hypothetical protein
MTYPTNPTAGDTHILSGKTWKYDGTNWSKLGLSRTLSAPVAFSDLTNTPTTLSGYGITDGATGTSESVPVGTVIYYSANTPPTNFIKANGDAVSRTTYSDLFTVIGTTYGAGDGSTTFNVPDLRGEFMRGWDDSRGIDNGRSFGSAQADEFKSHSHDGYSNLNLLYSGGGGRPNDAPSGKATSGRAWETLDTGGTETRPRNIALLACIKYQATSSGGGGGGGGGSLSNIVEDTTPQLGGNLDAQTFDITTTGKILYANMYATEGDLPSAASYHGMFAHVHGTGAGYFAHAGNWVKLANYADISSASASASASVVYPSDWGSPTNTYTSSGTWSKGSLDDDAFVWFYLCGGGRGGNSDSYPSTSSGGTGGSALLVYGTAGHFDGAAYVIGAGGAGGNSGGLGSNGGNTTITTTSANGSIAYVPTTSSWNDSFATDIPNRIMVSAPSNAVAQSTTLISGRAKAPYDFIIGANSEPTGWAGAETTGNLYAWTNAPGGTSGLYGTNGIFGGGGGGGRIQHGGASTIQPPGGSLYAGAGGAHPNGAGSVPGGGGGGNSSSGQAGAGGAGNLRVYHV